VEYYLNLSGATITTNTYPTFYFTKIYITIQTTNATIYENEPYNNQKYNVLLQYLFKLKNLSFNLSFFVYFK